MQETDTRTLVWPQVSHSNRRPIDERFESGAAYVDGEFCPIEEAKLPLLDWGFLRSDACQETISAWNGEFFRLQDHLDRFERSLKRLRMEFPEAPGRIREIVHELVSICGYSNAYV